MAEPTDISPTDQVRDAAQIARRTLALFGSVGRALGAPRKDILKWLKDEELWAELSPSENAYLSARRPTEREHIEVTWQSERLIVLLWVLAKVERLPPPNEQCNTSVFQDHLPPYVDISTSKFIADAKRRSDQVILDMADELLQFHWRARNARFNSQPIPPELDIEIIQERHHAINWVIGYEGLSWDDITTDT